MNLLSPERLYQRGLLYIENLDGDRARNIANKLISRRFTGGHELLGLAYELENDFENAICSYRKGIEVAPQLALFWSRLGSALSNSGEYEEALDSYREFEKLSGDSKLTAYNIALIHWRQGKPQEALAVLELAGGVPPEYIANVRGLCLIDLNRAEEALEGPVSKGVRVRGLAALRREAETRELAREILEDDHGDADARIALLQFGSPNPKARYRVQVDGGPPGGPILDAEKYRFMHTFIVDADDEEIAFDLTRPFEPRATELTVQTTEVLSEAPGMNAGVVFSRSGYTLYCIKPTLLDRLRSALGARVYRRLDSE